jgi:predicted DCC family thiol-disulfide oxidoreductase YuxK
MDRTVVLFDRDCGFCRWSAGRIAAWDRRRRLRFVALQDLEADRLLGGMSGERKMVSWHLVTPDGRIHSAGAAVAPLARLLPGGAPVAATASLLPGTTERLYTFVSRRRDRLERLLGRERCTVDPGSRR